MNSTSTLAGQSRQGAGRTDLPPLPPAPLPLAVLPEHEGEGNSFERMVGRMILVSRYILIVFYLGLVVALGVYAIVYARLIYDMAVAYDELSGVEALATILSLIDFALVASLVVMVIISNYENFVGRIVSNRSLTVSWVARLDPGSLKIKIGSTIITISSIYLLKIMIDVEQYRSEVLLWKLAIFFFFILAALALVWIDRIGAVYRDATGESRLHPGGKRPDDHA
ncbi:YqhA family protein (plasmid) [Skermanella mucosa]|uniref:YqhA family protein n=1 Tax=Skermanella mucosa TaxID=1789672 RepID=UPI00192CB197|nr:YqhA family protein [Skermanella mucosa]UEM25301.1 YqhA family protein [Skermanella mucosa]